MKKRVIKITAVLAAALVVVLGLAGLDYLVNEDRKIDPVTRNVKLEKKDSYNQYGLKLDAELADEPFYEDESHIYYKDRILKKAQYKDINLENAAVILEQLQRCVPEDVDQYCMLIPERIVWEDGHQEQKDLYQEFIEKVEDIIPDQMELLDVLPILNEQNDEYLFFRTYSGWTARGAYYGSVALCEDMEIEPVDLSGYEEHMYSTFQGADKQNVSIKHAQNEELYKTIKAIPSDPLFFYLLPEGKNEALRVTNKNGIEAADKIRTVSKSRVGEAAFIGSEYQWALAEGDRKDSDKKEHTALIICDRNGQLLVPYLTSYYKQVYVINSVYNQFSVEQFQEIFQKYDVSDVILAQTADRFGEVPVKSFLENVRNMGN